MTTAARMNLRISQARHPAFAESNEELTKTFVLDHVFYTLRVNSV